MLALPTKNEFLELWPYLEPQERKEIEKHLEAIAGFSPALLPDPVEWIEQHFYIPELNGPIKLYPYQKACLREALSVGDDGLFKYSVIVWSDIKKSAKSTIAAAVALFVAYHHKWGQIVSVANDLKQADSRVAYYMRRAIELNPKMKAKCKVRNYKATFPNGTFFESVPIDPTGEAGGNADMVIFSELWGSHSKAQQRMWTEMTLPPLKYGKAFRWVETYAGYVGESPTLEMLHEQGKTGQQLDGLPVWINDKARLFLMWNQEPRLPWQTPEYYASEAAILTDSEFRRVHKNQWVSSVDQFVPDAWWDACKGDRPDLAPGKPLVFALDAAITGDCFGMVGVSRHPDDNTRVVVRYAQKWNAPKNGKINYAPIEQEIRRLADQNNVIEWAYDPYQLHSMCSRLATDGVGWFREFKQGEPRIVADKQLQDLIRDRRIVHGGEADLTQHIKNANAKQEGERRIRLVKRTNSLKIDLAVCLSMSVAECMRMRL
jgi:phage terminase large subunit-like protein